MWFSSVWWCLLHPPIIRWTSHTPPPSTPSTLQEDTHTHTRVTPIDLHKTMRADGWYHHLCIGTAVHLHSSDCILGYCTGCQCSVLTPHCRMIRTITTPSHIPPSYDHKYAHCHTITVPRITAVLLHCRTDVCQRCSWRCSCPQVGPPPRLLVHCCGVGVVVARSCCIMQHASCIMDSRGLSMYYPPPSPAW